MMLQSNLLLPSPALRPFIHHYWVMRAGDSYSMELNVMPMGCMKWMFHRGRPFSVEGICDLHNTASICGQYSSSVRIGIFGQTDLLFVFFQPYAMKMITGIPCEELTDANVSMDDLGDHEFKQLKRMVLESEDDQTAISLIEEFILRQLARRNEDCYLKQFMTLCRAIDHYPNLTLTHLADTACLSERQLRRVFSDHIGLSPKQMLRIRRCLAATKAIQQTEEVDFAQLIVQFGFADHSHLYKEFKLFAGMSPSEYIQHLKNIRSHQLLSGYRAYHG